MECRSAEPVETKKRRRPLDREFNTAVYCLRCKQLNLSMWELLNLEYGEVSDMMIEAANDREEYDEIATQDDFDQFGELFG